MTVPGAMHEVGMLNARRDVPGNARSLARSLALSPVRRFFVANTRLHPADKNESPLCAADAAVLWKRFDFRASRDE